MYYRHIISQTNFRLILGISEAIIGIVTYLFTILIYVDIALEVQSCTCSCDRRKNNNSESQLGLVLRLVFDKSNNKTKVESDRLGCLKYLMRNKSRSFLPLKIAFHRRSSFTKGRPPQSARIQFKGSRSLFDLETLCMLPEI